MSNTIEFEGQTEEEAVTKACAALKLGEQDLDYTMVDGGSTGVFGLGSRPVRIRVRAPEGEQMEPNAEPQSSTEEEAKERGIVGPAPEKAAKAEEVARGLADRMGLEANIAVRDEDAQIVVVIEEKEGSTDVADTLGKSRPPAIPSFQFLLNKIVNRFPDDRKHIVVEVPSVPRRERAAAPRREERAGPSKPVELDPDLDPTLVAMGKFLAERAQEINKVITVHPMLPSDRRAVHQTITAVEGAETVSEGEGLYRRMHIVPEALRPKKKRRRRGRRRKKGSSEETAASAESEGAESAEDQDAPIDSPEPAPVDAPVEAIETEARPEREAEA